MKIITVSHQKGGVGKTTLALNLAACFKKGGLRVGVMDTDLQGSLAAISTDLDGIEFIPFEKIANLKHLKYDIIVIDTPPYLMDSMADLFALSDYVLVPTKIGFFDVLAIRATMEIIRQVKINYPKLKYGVVLNMLKNRTSITEEIRSTLVDYGAPVLKTMVFDRVAYTRSSITSGVFSTDDIKAQEEMFSLADEIFKDLGI
jgi:chromosome partitioning protein